MNLTEQSSIRLAMIFRVMYSNVWKRKEIIFPEIESCFGMWADTKNMYQKENTEQRNKKTLKKVNLGGESRE